MAKESGSKLNVELGDKYIVTSNSYTFVLVERKKIKSGVKAGQDQFNNCGYFQNFNSLAKFLINKEIRESELTSLQQIAERVDELGEGISKLLTQILNQSEGKTDGKN